MLRLASERSLLFGLFVALGAAGCVPPCDQLCRKARSCDLTPRLAQDECVEACQRQEVFYQVEDDREGTEAYNAHRRCIVNATCEEILDGVCYDETVFNF